MNTQINIGWAQTDITPDRPIYVIGQLYSRISSYVHDPITATCLVLENGDRILISNLFYEPEAGDIVVLRKLSFSKDPIVKRVIATEGQVVKMDFERGIVYVDDVALEEDYINDYTYLEEGTEFPLTVPKGSVFVLGDNRNHSSDSRDSRLGTVDTRYVIGKAVFLAFPGTGERGYTEKRTFGRIGVME